MTAPTLVFDLDGTLVDTAPDLVKGLNAAMRMENLEPVGLEEVRRLVGSGVRVMLSRGLQARNHFVPDERYEELVAAFFVHYENHIADYSRPYPDVEPVLAELAEAGYRLAVCTNKPESLSLLLLEALGLKRLFAAICGADTFPVKKPEAQHLLGTIERAEGEAGRAVMIGDSRTDYETARNARVPCILMDYGYTEIHVSKLGADAVLSHFRDVPEAARRLLG